MNNTLLVTYVGSVQIKWDIGSKKILGLQSAIDKTMRMLLTATASLRQGPRAKPIFFSAESTCVL